MVKTSLSGLHATSVKKKSQFNQELLLCTANSAPFHSTIQLNLTSLRVPQITMPHNNKLITR